MINQIFNIDVLQGLRGLEDNSIDLVVTSPPYNKGFWSRNRNPNNGSIKTKSRRIDYGVFNDTMAPEDYERWQRDILNELIRVIKPTGSIFYNHCDIQRDCQTYHPLWVWDYPVRQMIVWDRCGTPKLDKRYFFPTTEYVYWIQKSKEARPYFNRKDAKFNCVVWRFNPDRHSEHPAPFPLELPENCILACTKEGDVVLDPFMGSGTTALAAKKHNRNYIGFELNPEYITKANERLNGTYEG